MYEMYLLTFSGELAVPVIREIDLLHVRSTQVFVWSTYNSVPKFRSDVA